MSELQGKFYRIGEVSAMTEIPAHILRYWEKEFSFLKPVRDHRGHRLYTEQHLARINQIKELVYREGYRLQGAKRHFRNGRSHTREIQSFIAFLRQVLRELKEIVRC
ncbi:MAG TPA: MerR family transcriptional regulator [bacterium]|nr:MerR family transcriptional regulator [bacterium]